MKKKNTEMSIHTARLIAMVELEDKLTARMEDFGFGIQQITMNDVTRELREKHPELIEKIRDFIKKKNELDKQNKN